MLTDDRHGMIEDAPEPLPTEVFLRSTPLSAADDAIRAFAKDIAEVLGRKD